MLVQGPMRLTYARRWLPDDSFQPAPAGLGHRAHVVLVTLDLMSVFELEIGKAGVDMDRAPTTFLLQVCCMAPRRMGAPSG